MARANADERGNSVPSMHHHLKEFPKAAIETAVCFEMRVCFGVRFFSAEYGIDVGKLRRRRPVSL
jgi:hypothetical protein